MIYVHWEKPRRWAVKIFEPYDRQRGGYHKVIGVVAISVDKAIEATQAAFPTARILSVNDTGQIDIVADAPK